MRGIAIAVVAAAAGSAAAQPGDPGEAGALFERARQLKAAGHQAEACQLFDRSYQLDPAPGTALNVADCLEQQGQLRRAWGLFDQVAGDPHSGAARSQFAHRRAEALAAKLATVVVALPDPVPAGLVVRLGGDALPPGRELRALVEPGDVALVATVPGRPAFTATLHAAAGATVAVAVPAFDRAGGRRALYLTGGLGAAGVAGLGVSLGFAIAARRSNQDALDHGCAHRPVGLVCTSEDGRRLVHLAGARADLATGFAIGGAVLVGAAATVFWLSRETVRVSPIASRDALGVTVAGRF